MEENEIPPSAGPSGNRADLHAQFSEFFFTFNAFAQCTSIQTWWPFLRQGHRAFHVCVPSAPFSPRRWASGGLSEGFIWVGGPGGVQTLVQWMSRHCEGSVTRLHTDKKDCNVQKGHGPLLSTLKGIDQPTRVENKHDSVWVNTEQVTGNVT